MQAVYYLLVFISGCFIGSFLKLTADRSVKDESIMFGRSKCELCGTLLKPKNLIPLLSFIYQKGKCEYCEKKLSVSYPLSELFTGLLFLFTALHIQLFSNLNIYSLIYFVYVSVVISFYIVMIFSDLRYMIIPDKVVYTAILFVFGFITLSLIFDIYSLYRDLSIDTFGKYLVQAGFFKNQVTYLLKHYVINVGSALLIGFFFVSLVLITNGKGMGGGDVKLGFLIGLFNPFPYNVLGIFLGFVIGSVFSLGLILLKKKTVKDIIPFGPFLIAGSLVAFFFGVSVLSWYFNFL